MRDTAARVRSGYYQAEYGHRLDGVPLLGALAARLNPAKQIAWDHLIRHLPPPSHPGAPLLDVGCGSGRFLNIAASLGYAASGFDPDPIAAQLATSRGLDVRVAQLPNTGLPSGYFEQITLSHVFEHVHSPTRAAAEILRLLQPGGRVWFCQPNLQSLGLAHFGKYWRGLEAPRHLCLFDAEGLRDFLAQNGFCDIRRLPGRSEAVESFQASLTMQEHQIPKTGHVPVGWNSTWAESAAQSNKATARAPERAENLTMSARKPLD
jgi:2-polyprenyl-3-methyl-5-hydroxy-6-metoxy-1,4-benzoquinol methylase